MGRAAALPQRETDDDSAAEQRAQPEQARRPLVRDPRAGDRGGERQQPDDDGAVRGGHVAHRPRREQRKADDDAGGDEREPRQQRPPGPRDASDGEDDRRQHGGDDGPPEAHEHRVHRGDRDARRGQRQAEARDADKSEQQAFPAVDRGRSYAGRVTASGGFIGAPSRPHYTGRGTAFAVGLRPEAHCALGDPSGRFRPECDPVDKPLPPDTLA